VRLGCSGNFTLKVTEKGTYTAVLHIGNRKHSATGRLNLEGCATNVLARPGTNALTVVWAVSLDGTDRIVGSVSDGAWTADLLGDRAVYGRDNPAPLAGKYTLVILGNPGSALAPGGDSYGTASVAANGSVTIKAPLADKSALAGKVSLSKNGQWPLYGSLYSGKGAILGWVTFSDQNATDFDGVLSWIKPALGGARYYPDGFTSEAALLGSHYVRPPDHLTPILPISNALTSLTGGNLGAGCTNDAVLGADSKVTSLGPEDMGLSFNLSSGLFKGHLTPAGGGPAVIFKGAALQKSRFASGHFLGTNQSGRVVFQAAP